MLSALLRTASVTVLMTIAACEFSSAPSIGQSSGSKKKGDAGGAGTDRRVVVAKPTPGLDAAADAEARPESDASVGAAKGGAGGQAGSKSAAGKSGGGAQDDGDQQPDEKDPGEQPQDDKKPDDKGQNQDQDKNQNPDRPADQTGTGRPDAGAQKSTPDGGLGDSGARPMVDNPTGVLEALAKRSPGGRTATTINRFLETVATGEAPASSIKEFLETINDEMMCEMNPFATECLAACQAVSTTCWACMLDEACRTSLLDICGYAALAGCARR